MDLDPSATVAQLVLSHPSLARVFQRRGIDYCCRGGVTVTEACRDRGLDPAAVQAELAAALPAGGEAAAEDPRALSTAALLARIVDRHHGYLRRALPFVEPLAAKVARVHGDREPRLEEVYGVVSALSAALLPHLEEEETMLFPALAARTTDPGVIARELERMLADHLEVGALLGRLRALTDGFVPPAWGCNSYRVLMAELEAVEADTLTHVHLENHVLAPRFAAR
ncbi:MAG: iron-sulfur cluster repair di-iron protein [Anaeromyxobacteraceae bacterium]